LFLLGWNNSWLSVFQFFFSLFPLSSLLPFLLATPWMTFIFSGGSEIGEKANGKSHVLFRAALCEHVLRIERIPVVVMMPFLFEQFH
jgi:hypothetical protein